MEMLQGVWKQPLRPRAVVGTALKFLFPVLQITSPDHLALFRDTINDHCDVILKVPIDFSKGGVGIIKWTAHFNFPVRAH